MAGRWGYAKPFVNRPVCWVAERLSEVSAMGGNYMINLAPSADGTLPEGIINDLEWLAKWQEASHPALFEAKPLPTSIRSNVPASMLGNEIFLFVPNPCYHLLNLTGVPAPADVRLVHTDQVVPHGHIPTFREGPRLNILVPPESRMGGDIVRVRFSDSIS